MRETIRGCGMAKGLVTALSLALSTWAAERVHAMTPVPKEAVRTLMVAKGKPCRSGVVFVDGKYLPPPYVVKRYGTAIMINDVQVTAPLVAWEEFVKTQKGASATSATASATVSSATSATPAATTSATPVAPAASAPAAASAPEDDPLADLFDDDPKPAKRKAAAKASPATTYTFNGSFVMNDEAKKLLERINRFRTDVNARLLSGGFWLFGSNYPRVSGEAREARRLLGTLPGLLRKSDNAERLYSEARRNGLYYLTEPVARDLFRHKHLYPQIEARAQEMKEEEKLKSMMNSSFRR